MVIHGKNILRLRYPGGASFPQTKGWVGRAGEAGKAGRATLALHRD